MQIILPVAGLTFAVFVITSIAGAAEFVGKFQTLVNVLG